MSFPLAKAAVSFLTHKGVRTDPPEGRFPAPNSMTAQGNSIIKVPEAGLSHNEVIVLQVLPAASSGCFSVSEDEREKDFLMLKRLLLVLWAVGAIVGPRGGRKCYD